MNKFRLGSVAVLLLGLTTAFAQADKKDEKKEEAKAAQSDAKEVAVIKTTEGEMVVEFWTDIAPKTVENFKTLAKKGFYDGTAFHRVIKGFMIQGGDPLSKDESKKDSWGTGDPGYKINAEFSQRKHTRGVISMARNGDPAERTGAMPGPQFANSAGSQFFICHADVEHLNGRYTCFGKLVKGEDVLDKIAATPVGGPSRTTPLQRMNVESVKIVPADSVK